MAHYTAGLEGSGVKLLNLLDHSVEQRNERGLRRSPFSGRGCPGPRTRAADFRQGTEVVGSRRAFIKDFTLMRGMQFRRTPVRIPDLIEQNQKIAEFRQIGRASCREKC